jgi:hypothetical protein
MRGCARSRHGDTASEGRGAARMILRERLSPQGLQRLLTLALNTLSDPFPEEGGAWEMEMNAQATKLQAVENDLKQLMADVTRAMEKAQEAVARIASTTPTATTEIESTTSS